MQQPVTSTSVLSSLLVSKRQRVWLCNGRIVPFRRLICRQSITVDCIYLAIVESRDRFFFVLHKHNNFASFRAMADISDAEHSNNMCRAEVVCTISCHVPDVNRLDILEVFGCITQCHSCNPTSKQAGKCSATMILRKSVVGSRKAE